LNIRLLNTDSALISKLEPDKIVNVKILKREAGTAIIELNGIKTKASIDVKVPDNFFAFVEPSPEQDGQRIVKLRILSPLVRTRYFIAKREYNLLQSFKSVLMGFSLPLNEDFFKASRIIYDSGLKLDKKVIKTVHLALIKYGEKFAELIAGFIRKGLDIDDEFVDFFFNYKKLLRHLLRYMEMQKEETPADLPRVLQDLFRFYFSPDSSYCISLIDKGNKGEGLPFQWRKENLFDRERYYFDFSNEKTGSFIMIMDDFETFCKIDVFLDREFLDTNRNRLSHFSINRLKKIEIAFRELKNPCLFWTGQKEKISKNHETGLFNLDISV